VGLIARSVEELGISTVYLGSCRDIMAQVKAPRNVFLDFPLGRQCGKAQDVDLQTRILKDTLNVLATAKVPGEVVDLPYHWGEPFDWKSYRRDVEQMLKEEGQETQNWAPKM
jgi:D-proline reductase (dithiol) PrdB